MHRACVFVFLIFAGISGGCAGVQHLPVRDMKADDTAKGVRYYRESQYLLIYSRPDGMRDWTILHLPDPTKKMSAEPYNFWSKVTTNMKFENGVLTDSADTADATVVPKAILDAVKTVVSAAGLLAKPTTAPHPQPEPPVIYKIVVTNDIVSFKGLKKDGEHAVSLSTGEMIR
jgi:hypothetical protein